MHCQLGNTDIHCADAEFGGSDRSDRRTATHVAANRNGLHWYIGFTAQRSKHSRCLAVSCIALIGIEFNHRPGVEPGAVLLIMFIVRQLLLLEQVVWLP